MTLVQEIHNSFIKASEIAINPPITSHPMLDAFILNNNLSSWQFRYPSQLFVTENQVRKICRKYKLVMGESFLFNEKIPEKNQLEIDSFKFHQHDIFIQKESNNNFDPLSYLRDEMRFSLEENMGFGGEYSSMIRCNSEVVEMGDHTEKFVLSLGSQFALIFQMNDKPYVTLKEDNVKWNAGCGLDDMPNMETLYQNHPRFEATLIHQVSNKESFIFNQKVIREDLAFTYHTEYVANEFMVGGTQREVTFDFHPVMQAMKELVAAKEIDLNIAGRKIVAPASKFHNTESFILDEGYRFKINPSPSYQINSPFIPDPVVLQPVDGGYLILSMWGDESEIEELQNGNNN